MEPIKLFDSELKVMEVIWSQETITAKEVSRILAETIGWNKNTTYTIIKKLVDKQIVRREEPDFLCTALVKKTDIQNAEINSLIERLYHGSKKLFFASFLQNETLSKAEIEELKNLIDRNGEV